MKTIMKYAAGVGGLCVSHSLFYWMGNNSPLDKKTYNELKDREPKDETVGEAAMQVAPFVITGTVFLTGASLLAGAHVAFPLIALGAITHTLTFDAGRTASTERKYANESHDSQKFTHSIT